MRFPKRIMYHNPEPVVGLHFRRDNSTIPNRWKIAESDKND